MGGHDIIVLTFMLLSYLVLSYQTAPNGETRKNSPTLVSGNRTCVNLVSNGSLISAPKCSNGRHLSGCCVDRSYCDYGTPAIDRTLYGPVGYKSSCDTMHVCCPLEYVLPYAETNNASMDFDDETSDDLEPSK